MPYVDGFVIPVSKSKLPSYLRMARKASKIWKEYGALDYRECVGDDLNVKKVVPFGRAAKVKIDGTLPLYAIQVDACVVVRARQQFQLYRVGIG